MGGIFAANLLDIRVDFEELLIVIYHHYEFSTGLGLCEASNLVHIPAN